ncbi:MAG: hypothetical protein IPK22_29070 [Verrucomicrobiaceae bacterium]|nr:hypothetical protein [Verrucomicrobiaceae bacterium]
MKSFLQRFEEGLGRLPKPVFDALGEGPFEVIEALNVPEHLVRRLVQVKYDGPEALAVQLVAVKTLKDASLIKSVADRIGEFISEQLVKGKYDSLRIMSEGLLRLHSGGDFRGKGGPPKSFDDAFVLMMFFLLIEMGIDSPSQSEVRMALNSVKNPIRKARVSKIFDELGLKELAGDSRSANSEPGKRRRRKLPTKHD